MTISNRFGKNRSGHYILNIMLVAATLAFALSTGCSDTGNSGGDEAGAGDSDAQITPGDAGTDTAETTNNATVEDPATQFLIDAVKKACERRHSCDIPLNPYLDENLGLWSLIFQYDSIEACQQDAARLIDDVLATRVPGFDGVQEGRRTFDQAAAARCLKGIEFTDCRNFAFDRFLRCPAAFDGQVGVDGECEHQNDCQDGLACAMESSTACVGTCRDLNSPPDDNPQPRPTCGETTCDADEYCADDWFDDSFICVPKSAGGEQCNPEFNDKADPVCADGYYCNWSTEKCRQRSAIGGECTDHNRCGIDAYCFNYECEPRKPQGGYCFNFGSDECMEGLPCLDERCGYAAAFDYCDSERPCGPNLRCLDEDESGFRSQCVPVDHGSAGDECGTDSWCRNGLFCSEGECVEPPRPEGASCRRLTDCDLTQDLYCSRPDPEQLGRCLKARRLMEGDPCDHHAACPENTLCNGTCTTVTQAPEGESCIVPHTYCDTGTVCRPAAGSDMTCRPHVAEDGGCQYSYECEPGLFCDMSTQTCKPVPETEDDEATCG